MIVYFNGMFYTMNWSSDGMKKRGFSSEVLCLFFIVTIVILFGKILMDVKSAFEPALKDLSNNVRVDTRIYSHRVNERIEYLKDIMIIRDTDDLKFYNDLFKKVKLNDDTLINKLKNYNDDYFKTHSLVILSLVNDDNVISMRSNSIYKNDDGIVIELTKKYKNSAPTKKYYTWFAVVEIADVDSPISLKIINS